MLKKKRSAIYKNGRQSKFLSILSISILFSVIVNVIFSVFILNYLLTLSLKSETIIEENKVNQNIVFLGDSITEAYDLDKYYKDEEAVIINSGYSGNTTEDILKNLYKRAIQYKPQKIFLLIGTNDIGFGVETESTIDNIEMILQKLTEECENTKIYVESIYPVNKTLKDNEVGKRTNKVIKKINSEIEKITVDYGLTYIDIYSILLDDDGNLKEEYTKDGLHLSTKGYDAVTNILSEYLTD